jgi:single-stranded DNA-specific DHH superfamily exonuclease
MFTKKQVEEIKEHLHKAQNPLFLFDNDQDGLCSFLLLQRYLGRGKGVPIKSFPSLLPDYFRKIEELKADYIFILDKPVVSEEFFEKVEQINLPVVWIDHHLINKEDIPSFVNYYNPLFNKKPTNEPVTALCYQISGKKEDLWLAVIGCISDGFVPDFYSDFEKKYSDLSLKSDKAFDIFYKSQIGRIARMFGFALKDRITNVIIMLRFLMKVSTPYAILEENSKNHLMHNRFRQVGTKYQKLLKKAIAIGKKQEKMLFFQYGGDLSISADLANELHYLFPEKIIVVIYVKGIKANISMRNKNVRDLLSKAIGGLEDARGGGHENAVGGQIRIEDLEKFRENLEKLIK